jgi:hypothetical protein
MNYSFALSTLVLMGVSFTMPDLAPANGLQYSEGDRSAPGSFILKVQSTERWETDRPDLGGKGIYSYGSELFNEPKLFRESQDKSSDKEMRSYSESLSPSFDVPASVNGGSRGGSDPLPGLRPQGGDPSVRDLSGMDGGGFAPPGAYPGSMRR